MENPESLIEVIVSGSFLLVGKRICSSDRRRVFSRSGGTKPFFHPSSLKAELARAMLNLARVRKGSIILDPFSGTGTILVEAYELQAIPVGLEIDPAMAYPSIRNYKWFGAVGVCQILGDAGHMPFRSVDAIVTDPPYGRRASTHGLESLKVYKGFIKSAAGVLRESGWMVFLAPSGMPVEDFVESNGLRIMETYFIEVHSSLTRKLLVARN
ncbi:MAG: DNA methyltransferase [Thermoproteota archaeon]